MHFKSLLFQHPHGLPAAHAAAAARDHASFLGQFAHALGQRIERNIDGTQYMSLGEFGFGADINDDGTLFEQLKEVHLGAGYEKRAKQVHGAVVRVFWSLLDMSGVCPRLAANVLSTQPPMNAPYRELFTGLLEMEHPEVHPKKYQYSHPATAPSAAPTPVSIQFRFMGRCGVR